MLLEAFPPPIAPQTTIRLFAYQDLCVVDIAPDVAKKNVPLGPVACTHRRMRPHPSTCVPLRVLSATGRLHVDIAASHNSSLSLRDADTQDGTKRD